jgi:hypothetical protein
VKFYCYLICLQEKKTQWRSWLRHCATSWKVAGSITDGVIRIFHWHNPSGRTMALGLTQPPTEMSTRNTTWGVKAAGAQGWQTYHLHVPIVLKSASLKEPSGPVRTCNGIALPFTGKKGLLRSSFRFFFACVANSKTERDTMQYLSGKRLHRRKSLKNTVLEHNHLCRCKKKNLYLRMCHWILSSYISSTEIYFPRIYFNVWAWLDKSIA